MKTIHKVFLILLASLTTSALFAQSDLSFGYRRPQAEIDTFVQKVTGAGTLTAAVRAADGGYVTASRINNTSFLVMKIKASGQKQWQRRLDFHSFISLVSTAASINGIAQTTDGGFVLAGQVGCPGGDCLGIGFPTRNIPQLDPSGATLVKLRTNGTVVWKKSLAEPGVGYDYLFSSVNPTPDGGVIATGRRLMREFDVDPRLFIARFTPSGDVVWEKSFGTLMDNIYGPIFRIHSTATSDRGLVVAFVIPARGVQVMKITNSGNVVWKKLLNLGFDFQSVGATSDGGAILIETPRNFKKLNVVVLKADGTLNWKAGYSLKVPGVFQSVSSPVQTPDGGYVVTGSTRSANGFIAKIDSSRRVAFQNTFGGRVAGAVFGTADGGFVLFGGGAAGLLVSKMNSEGIVPGCSFFNSLGPATSTSFGLLKIGPVNTTTSDDLSLASFDFELTSVVMNQPVSTVCQ